MARRQARGLSIASLQAAIRRHERLINRHLKKLVRKRDSLASALAEVESEIGRAGGRLRVGRGLASLGVGRRRPRNDSNLADALAKTLKNATMSVTEVSEAVQKRGYRTTSPNFRTIVNQTLIKDSRFKRVGRGQYTAK